MKRGLVTLGAVLFVAAIFALIVPMWISTAGMGLPASGWKAVIAMIIGCFAVGGGLMFLIFYSARKGHDDIAHNAGMRTHRPTQGRSSDPVRPHPLP